MKKSSFVMLTIVATLVVSSCAVQKVADNLGPQDPVYAEQSSDTSRPVVRDTTVRYNYYYRSYFWDGMYRMFFPRRYYYVINQPDFRPRHLRPVRGTYAQNGHATPQSGRRGGFGRSGSAQAGHS